MPSHAITKKVRIKHYDRPTLSAADWESLRPRETGNSTRDRLRQQAFHRLLRRLDRCSGGGYDPLALISDYQRVLAAID